MVVDVTGIELVTPCLQSSGEIKSESLFRLRLTRQFHQADIVLLLQRCSNDLKQTASIRSFVLCWRVQSSKAARIFGIAAAGKKARWAFWTNLSERLRVDG